jgi:putative hydrolase of the HAD superfamily
MRGGRAVIFDLDDTLYREHDYVRSGFAAVSRHLADDAVYPALLDEWERHGRGRVFDAVVARFGIAVEVAELVSVYREHEPELALYPDAERALTRLAAAQAASAWA